MKYFLTILIVFITLASYGQTNTFPSSGSAGIGTTSPNASSLIDIVSTSQGVLVPRMTLSQRNAISSPATGLLIYQTDSSPGFYFYNGTTWTVIYSGAALNQNLLPDADNSRSLGSTTYSWNNMYADGAFYLNSNRFLAQSTADNNTFIGSNAGISNTSSSGVKNTFVGYESGYYTTESHNTGVGYQALYTNSTGYNNTAIGMGALTSNTTGYTNTAIGSSTMYYNTAGNDNTATGKTALMSNTTGNGNTVSGINAMRNNTGGHYNTATGGYALYSNTTGESNVAMGHKPLYSNTTGEFNVGLGYMALYSTNTGSSNIAVGGGSLYSNTTGSQNASCGSDALYWNTTGYYNSALGRIALAANTTGTGNVGVGYRAGQVNDASNYCTFLGYDADQSSTSDYSNSSALGNGSRISASDQIRIGNSSVSSIGGYANWTNISDGRFKSGIKENVPGLEFIELLRPITYHLDVTGIHEFLKENNEGNRNEEEKEKATYTGFIAQEVEVAAKKIGYDFSGVDIPGNENSLYGLRYAEFTVPLVKAVQELNALNNELRYKNEELENRLKKLELMDYQNNLPEKITQAAKVFPSNIAPRLDDNIPNPFTGKTIIGYFVPVSSTSAQLTISAENGTTLMTIDIKAGDGRIELDAFLLASGKYFYSLIVDNKVTDSREMILIK